MISAMAANGALRCPDIIYCSSSLQISTDPSLLFFLDRSKERKPPKKEERERVQATVFSRGQNPKQENELNSGVKVPNTIAVELRLLTKLYTSLLQPPWSLQT
jgi:hypothetical protein